ncbi:RNA polymerase sigma factor [Pedobacter sp. L105]|uniref:RNA polymerase sigma factor n=1 Tax=Pedobacter sp. L105 TaxID=1641871 RepID=UPI00131D4AE8|nr:sigma-70 family RNA polymerase sigma factor [Pedobacter sp. L105]
MITNSINSQICTHESSLYSFAVKFTRNHEDASDLVQDTMLRAIRYAGMYKEGTNLRAWLYTIMKNTFINNYRMSEAKNKVVQTHEDLTSLHLLKSAPQNLAEDQFIGEDINKALKNISPVYSAPFNRYVEGFKYQEIAEEFHIPIGTVKTRIHIARQLLKKSLKIYNRGIDKYVEDFSGLEINN